MTMKESRFTKKGVTYCRHTNIILNCLFCNIINRLEPGRIVFENNHYCVFRTIQPVTSMHLLVVPKRHIQNVSVLEGQEGISEVEALLSVGREALLELGGSQEIADKAQYCFHIPPHNSIDHLHLHAIGLPETMSFKGYMKYNQNMFYCKSANGFMEGLRNKKSSSSSSIRRIDAVDTTSSVTSKGGNSSIIQSANELNSIANTLKDDDGINIITCRNNTDVSMVDSSSSSSTSSNITSTRRDAKDNASYSVSSYGSHPDSRKNTDRFTTLMMARREDDDGDRVMDHKRSKI